MMLRQAEVARKAKITPRHLNDILAGRRHASFDLSLILEEITGLSCLSWVRPQKFFNPEAPYLYEVERNPWPPDLSHLNEEWRRIALEIIGDFPDRPPTREEFKRWMRPRRKKTAVGAGK